MRDRFSRSATTVAIAAVAVGAVISVSITRAQAPAASVTAPAAALKTPWGEPDLQGIWTDENDTPFQRSPKYANQEFFTEAQRAEFDRVRSALRGRDDRGERGSELDVAGAYNAVWGGRKRTGTSHVDDRRSARWPDPAADTGGWEDCRRRSRLSSCADASDADMQTPVAWVCRRQVRPDAGHFRDATSFLLATTSRA